MYDVGETSMKNYKKYLCIHLGSEETVNCSACCGITNICGKYENLTGEDPFKDAFNDRKRRREDSYLDEELGMYY